VIISSVSLKKALGLVLSSLLRTQIEIRRGGLDIGTVRICDGPAELRELVPQGCKPGFPKRGPVRRAEEGHRITLMSVGDGIITILEKSSQPSAVG
jgi:hypothetical protein